MYSYLQLESLTLWSMYGIVYRNIKILSLFVGGVLLVLLFLVLQFVIVCTNKFASS